MGVLAGPQAVQINNPYKLLKRNRHIFFIFNLWLSTYQPRRSDRTNCKIL